MAGSETRIECFQADAFSPATPSFSRASAEAQARVVDVLETHFHQAVGNVRSVEQAGGNELNSSNYRVAAAEGLFVVKRLRSGVDPALLDRQLGTQRWLFEQACPVPRSVASDEGLDVVSLDRREWCVSEFVEGDYFTGGEGELESTGTAIGRLLRTLRDLPSSLAATRKRNYDTGEYLKVLETLRARRTEWDSLFGETESAFLDGSWDCLMEVASVLDAHRDRIAAEPIQVCHTDLHPHNILTHEGRCRALIDFEAFSFMPLSATLGYGIYKLMKQHIVHGGHKPTACLTESLSEELGRGRLDHARLKLFAHLELVRRVLIVIQLNLSEADRSWNRFFPVHLAGLREIEVIFAP